MKKIFVLALALLIMLCLAGCGEKMLYKKANALLEAGNYEEAIARFQELGNFEDSAAKCEEAEKGIEYEKGLAFLEAEDYENAKKVFLPLGSFKDSAEKTQEARNGLHYNSALKLLDQQKYGEAYFYLSPLRDFKDASTYLDRYHTIEITADNWDTYFEVKEFSRFHEGASGELLELEQCHNVVLKEEYLPRYCVNFDSSVSFDFSYDFSFGDMKVDLEARTHEKADCNSYETRTGTAVFTDQALFLQNGAENPYTGSRNSFSIALALPKRYAPPDIWLGADVKNIVLTGVSGSITIYE